MINKNQHKNQLTEKGSRYISFFLGKDKLAVPLIQVKEIVSNLIIIPIPQTAPYLKGIIQIRENIISIFDLRTKMQIADQNDDETPIIILEISGMLIGAIVDSVDKVLVFYEKDLLNSPQIEIGIEKNYIEAIAQKNDSIVIILNVANVIDRGDKKIMNIY